MKCFHRSVRRICFGRICRLFGCAPKVHRTTEARNVSTLRLAAREGRQIVSVGWLGHSVWVRANWLHTPASAGAHEKTQP